MHVFIVLKNILVIYRCPISESGTECFDQDSFSLGDLKNDTQRKAPARYKIYDLSNVFDNSESDGSVGWHDYVTYLQ